MPLSISRAVAQVTIESSGGSVRVDGTTLDEKGQPIKDPAREIYIAIVGRRDDPVKFVVQAEPPGADPGWAATFPHIAPPLATGDKVHVVGLALSDTDPPYVWESHTVASHR